MRPVVYRILKRSLAVICYRYFHLTVEGADHLPKEGPLVLAANHVSFLDPPLLGIAVERPVHFMAKEELFRIPGLAGLLWAVGSFPVRRGQFDREALRNALEVLARGEVMGLFPEGTRSRDGRLGPARRGVAFLAVKARVPVVPVALIGTYRATAGRRLPRREPVTIRIGRPLPPPAGDPRDRVLLDAFSARLMQEIAHLLGEDFRHSGTNG